MAWYPKLRRRQDPRAGEDESTDPVVAPEDLDEEEGAENERDDSLEALAQQVETLSAQVAGLAARCEQSTSEIKAIRAQNDQLQADLKRAEGAQQAVLEDTLTQAQLAAHGAAVRAFGQGSAKLAAAEADIDACESVREAQALQRACEAATPAALVRSARQTTSQDPATAGKTSAQVRNGALTEEQKASHRRDLASRF